MKPIPSDNPDIIQWFIIGAFEAGASEHEIASMANLSRCAIHNAVSSFKKTGNPAMKNQKRKKWKTKLDPLHYGKLADIKGKGSSSNHMGEKMNTGIQEIDRSSGQLDQNRSPFIKPKRKPTATEAIDYVLNKCQMYDEKRISSRQKQKGDHNNTVGPSTPLQSYSPISSTLTIHAPDFHQPGSSMDNVSSPPSPPFTITHHPNNLAHKIDHWTRRDDKILLAHVLTHLGRWNELNQLFDGRHSDVDCEQRWNILQHYLFKQLRKNGTYGW